MQTTAEEKKPARRAASARKIRFQRIFTKETVHPFDAIEWVRRDAVIISDKGEEKFRQNNVEVPSFWNDITVNIVAEKYFRTIKGVKETSAKQMFHRVASWIAAQAFQQGIFSDAGVYPEGHERAGESIESDARIFYDELLHMLVNGMFAFNSPVWFNVGVVEKPQCSACFIQSVRDEMSDIMDLAKKEVMLFKGGSGTGSNLSAIRASWEQIFGGGWASGPVSFMRPLDAGAGATKSGGITRRAAKMVCLNIDHPDILEQKNGEPGFITCKADAEQVAHDLYSTGKYTAEFNVPGNIYERVGFQNANNSVRVTDEFMRAVERDKPFWTKLIKDGNPHKQYSARALWKEIARAAWVCGDPGLQFDTTINDWNTSPNSGRINASNPCQPLWATVRTREGIKTLGQVNIGDEIWSGKQWTKIKRIVPTGVKPVFRFYTRAGIFAGTDEHRVISNGVRVQAQHAETIDTAVCEAPSWGRAAFSYPQAVVDGLVFGDGMVKVCNDGADEYPLLFVGERDQSYFTDVEIAEFINKTPFDKLSHRVRTTLTKGELPKTYQRVIPDRFFSLVDSAYSCAFLRGLYSANGSVTGGRVALKASSFAVIDQVQQMLSGLGIRSYYTTNRAHDVEFENGNYTCRESYDLNITTDRDTFRRLIGFVQPYKQQKLDELCQTIDPSPRSPKSSYEVVEKQYVADEPVVDIEVEANEHTYWTGGLLVSNCAEYLYLDDTACNLASLNLRKFVKQDWSFNIEAFMHACSIGITAMEALVDASSYPSEAIERNSSTYRTLGLGYTNLGDLLTVWGLPYDSNDGRSVAAGITAIMGGAAQRQSALLAEVLGPFKAFDINRDAMLSVVKKHTNAAKRIPMPMSKQWHSIVEAAPEIWMEAYELGKKFGYRNGQVTVLAPTGTISFLMGARTTGIEPDLAIVVYKKLVGGGLAVMPNESVEIALRNLGYGDSQISAILNYVKEKRTIWGAPEFDDDRHGSVFAEALGPHALRPEAHILMMGAVQPFLSGGISKTINLPSSATVEDIESLYMLSWKQQLKCVAVYRDGCKLSQPISSDSKTKEGRARHLAWGERKRMPDERDAKTAKLNIGGTECYITPGFFEDGTLGEIFVRVAKQGSTLNGIIDAWATAVSIGLQHGVPPETYIEKFSDQEFEPKGFTSHPVIRRARSIPDLVAQWLALRFAPNAKHLLRLREAPVDPTPAAQEQEEERVADRRTAADGPPCTRCGNITKRAGSCYCCTQCGTTTGCG